MNPLANKPTEPQLRLLETVYEGRKLAGGPRFYPAGHQLPQEVCHDPDAWPVFQYVEGVLHQEYGLDAEGVLWECPSIRLGLGPGSYGWVCPDGGHLRGADTKIRLSVAGMAKVRDAASEVDVFMDTLAFLIERERQFVPNPSEVVAVEVWSGEVREELDKRWDLQAAEGLMAIRRLMAAEPATWHCQTFDEDDGAWRASLSPFLRRYAGAATATEYVQRVVDMSMPAMLPSGPMHPSSLSLPEAIDYLNAVWRTSLGNGAALIRISRAEAAAKLALECAGVDEFESRLSAFAGLLGQIQLPGASGYRRLVDLRAYLGDALGGAAATGAQDAVDDLRAVIDLRNWRQRPGLDGRAYRAADRLGIALPGDGWGVTWDQVRARSIAALSVIRDEVGQPPPVE